MDLLKKIGVFVLNKARRKFYENCDRYHEGSILSSMMYNCFKGIKLEGFVYAGITKDEQLLKIGMTRFQCPFCRCSQQKLYFEAYAYAESAREYEAKITKLLGKPVIGNEWFDNPKEKLQMLIDEKYLNEKLETEVKLARILG